MTRPAMTHTKDETLKLAKECGATTYTNRHYPDATAVTFSPIAWEKFCEQALAAPVQKRPQNCGTGYCSCIECVMEPAPVQPVGNWVWSWLMDWCKRNGIAPATQDSLFAMVKDARSKFDTTPPAAPVPLTDEQREEIAKGWRGRNWTVGDIIDATEAAHGITEKGQL